MKNILVTGSSSGIGMAIIEKYAKEGNNVVITYNNNKEDALLLQNELLSKYNIKVLLRHLDITDENNIHEIVDDIISNLGSIDILVNNAGIAIDTIYEDKTKDNFMKILETNLVGTFMISKYVGSYMIKNKFGNIINISSTNAIDSYYVESLDYDSSKAGLISLTHNLANYYAPYIRVNCICPGWVNTNMNKDLDNKFREKEINKILLKRFADPSEIANLVYFISQDEASYINDSIIKIDGGVKHD